MRAIEIKSNNEAFWRNKIKVLEIVLYSEKFDAELRRLIRNRQIRIDNAIKDYIMSVTNRLASR